MARLGDVCNIINGYAFRSEQYVDEGIRIIRIANVQKGYIEDSSPVFYSYDSKDAQKYTLEENDILMSLTGNVGRVAKLSKEFLPAALNQRVACLRIKDGVKLDKAYLFNLLNSDYFEQQCIAASKGVAQKNMSTEWLKEYEIPMLTIEQQTVIANILNNVSEQILLRKQQLAKLDELVKSRFVEMFGRCEGHKHLEEYASLITKGASPRWQGVDYCEEGTLFVTSENVREGYLDLSKRKYLDNRINEIQPRSMLKRNDILINIVGASIGRAAVYDCDEIANINQAVALVRADYSQVNQVYLMTFLNSPQALEMYGEMKKGGARDNLSLQNIADLQIPVAPMELQNQFAAFVAEVDKSKLSVQQSIDQLETLKASLMQKYFG